jgi:MFS family permease
MSTFAVALVPTYDSIGIWGAVLLTVLRFIQGVGVGGEWGGSVLLAMEWAKTSAHRGFIASWPQFGVPAGLFLANMAVLGFSALSGDAFLEWGWRIPFLLNIVLMSIGLYIRLRIFETPAFARLAEQGNISRAPTIEVLRRYPREVLLTAASRFAQQTAFYIFTAFIFTYGTQTLGASREFLLGAVMTASVVSFFTIPFFGWLSDRIGRRRMCAIGTAALGVFGFAYFALLDSGVPAWIFIAIVVSLIPHDMAYGPQAALIAECFPARLRYSGASLGYHLASVVAGGPAPLIAVALLAQYGSGYAVAGYIFVSAIASLTATLLLPDYTNKDISAH